MESETTPHTELMRAHFSETGIAAPSREEAYLILCKSYLDLLLSRNTEPQETSDFIADIAEKMRQESGLPELVTNAANPLHQLFKITDIWKNLTTSREEPTRLDRKTRKFAKEWLENIRR